MTATKTHPLVGAGLHWKDELGRVVNQAEVVAVFPSGGASGDVALIQYFDWIVGHPSTRRLIHVAELAATDRWVFYANPTEMNEHYERVDEYRNRHLDAKVKP